MRDARLEVARPSVWWARILRPGVFARRRRLSTGFGAYSLIVSVPRTAVPSSCSKGDSNMARRLELGMRRGVIEANGRSVKSRGSLDADIIIANAPDPVVVSDLEGKILQANAAVFALLGFRPDELIEQSLSRIISSEETREFLAALREVVERGVTRNARLNPRSASGKVIPTTLNASALRDPNGKVIGGIGILRDMRELDKARAYAESLIKNAPDPVFVSDLEGKILQANDAVFALLGFRPDELIEQSLSRIISPDETREFLAALREVVERGVTRNARLNPRSASGEVIPTTLNASALRDPDGRVIGAIGILRDMREYEQVVRDLEKSKSELQEKILDLEKFEEVVVGRELKMIALEKELESLRKELGRLKTARV